MKRPERLPRHARRRTGIENDNLERELGIVTPDDDLAHIEPRRHLAVRLPLGQRPRA
jgi:hypothetical protein